MADKVFGVLSGLGWIYVASRAVEEGNVSADTFFIGCAVLIAGFMAGRDNE
jgi:hypothetical protein